MFNAARLTANRAMIPAMTTAVVLYGFTSPPTRVHAKEETPSPTSASSTSSAIADSAAAISTTAAATSTSTKVDLTKVREAVINLIDDDAEKRGDGTSLAGTFIRLAWHSSGSYSAVDNSGGSNGCRMRFHPEANWGANAGLGIARDALEPIKSKFPTLSYADLYAYAGVIAIEECGGPTIPFRLGRIDMMDGTTSPPDGRLPDADKGSFMNTSQHIRTIFNRMGFMNDRDIVALCGAHAMGRCHTSASGYWGPWTNAENTFSNEYYRLLLEERWSPKVTHNSKPWSGPDQYEDSTGNLMMLPSDIALIHDPEFRKYVELYAKDETAFYKDFALAFSKLLELGVPFQATKPWYQFW